MALPVMIGRTMQNKYVGSTSWDPMNQEM
jgi:hypothetical protein